MGRADAAEAISAARSSCAAARGRPPAARPASHHPVRRRSAPGQATIEFAIVGAIATVMILVSIQYGLFVVQRYGANHVARETARWLAVRIDTTDAAATTFARTAGASLPGVSGTGITSVTVSPACASLTAGKCASRASGDAITVTVNTDQSTVTFLPTTFGVGAWVIQMPTTAPAARASTMLE